MAAPVLDSVTPAGPLSVATGTKVTFTVVAHDDDAHSETLTFKVKDKAGNWSDPSTVDLTWTDGLTLDVTSSAGTPISISGMTAVVG